jgi:hypothetical protein
MVNTIWMRIMNRNVEKIRRAHRRRRARIARDIEHRRRLLKKDVKNERIETYDTLAMQEDNTVA